VQAVLPKASSYIALPIAKRLYIMPINVFNITVTSRLHETLFLHKMTSARTRDVVEAILHYTVAHLALVNLLKIIAFNTMNIRRAPFDGARGIYTVVTHRMHGDKSITC
jgi:hypothetical protein